MIDLSPAQAADRIAKLHRGKLELINRPEGGLEARLSIPIQNF